MFDLFRPLKCIHVLDNKLYIQFFFLTFNPLFSQSHWLLISPHIINLESNTKVMRIKEMITN